MLQVAEGLSRSPSRADSGDSQAADVSSGTPREKSDSESRRPLPNSEQTAAAAIAPPAGGESAGSCSLSGSGDGDEKRDQSKEEPPLELRQQEGQ